ncbi:MAG: molybdopterin cofactor-binding domain-containing protein [Eubacteriales bacterium]
MQQGCINIKTAVDKSGKIIGSKNVLAWDGGAYTEYGVNIVKAAGWGCVGPYDIENIATDSYCVYANHPVRRAVSRVRHVRNPTSLSSRTST